MTARPAGAALVLALSAAATLAVVGPGAAAGLPVGSPTVDAHGSYWFQWFVADAVSRGASPYTATGLFHPYGKDLLAHTGGNVLDALLVAPVRALAGGTAAWNTLAAGVVFTNALAVGLVALRGGLAAGAVGALAGGLHPFLLHELGQGRPTQALVAPLVAALALGDAGLRAGGTARLVGAGALLAVQGWFYWFSAAFGVLALAASAIAARATPELPRRVLLLGGAAALGALPLAFPLVLAVVEGSAPGFLDLARTWREGAPWTREGDRVALTVLSLTGEAGVAAPSGFRPDGPTLGLTSLALALLAPGRWRVVAVAALLFALGPRLGPLPNPLWFALAAVPPFGRLWWPVRAVALLVPLAAIGLARLGGHRSGRAALVALALLLVAEPLARGLLPLPRWSPEVPAAVRATLGAHADRAAVVLPVGQDHLPLLWQAETGAPLLNGMYERTDAFVPAPLRALRADNTLLVALEAILRDPRADHPIVEADRAALAELGYGWIVVRKAALGPAGGPRAVQGRRRLVATLGEPAAEDETTLIWSLPSATGRDQRSLTD